MAATPAGGRESVESLGQDAANSDWLNKTIRVGLVAYGPVHLLIAWLAAVYRVVGYYALAEALGARSDSKGRSTTAKLMDLPAGLVVYGANMARRGLTEKFTGHLTAEGTSGETGSAYIWFGKVGHLAKGVSTAIVGGLFLYAAIRHQPKKSGGLDEALHVVLSQPFGPFLLGTIAIGIACYGLFCFARARHLSK